MGNPYAKGSPPSRAYANGMERNKDKMVEDVRFGVEDGGVLVDDETFNQNRDRTEAVRKDRKALSCKRVDLDLLQKRLYTIFWRDTTHLMDASFEGKLTDKDSTALINYIKLLKEMVKVEAVEASTLTDEQLAEIALKK